jgi:hypothetical protein
MTLLHFNFDSSDESVETYRTIFRTYYISPTNYDSDVIGASYYMLNNKVMFYTGVAPELDKTIPNVPIYTMNQEKIMLHDAVDTNATTTIIAAFSLT